MASWHGGWRWSLTSVGAGAVLCGLAGWLALPEGGVAPATNRFRAVGTTASHASVPAVVALPSAEARSASATATVRGATPAPVPAGLGAEQWQQLQEALADHPQREAESRRIVAFLQLQGRVQAFAEARQHGASRGELAALARPLQAELPQHLALGELNAAEALRLQAALLEVTAPDASAAAEALAEWRARHVSRPAGEAPNDPREIAFARAQQTALANFQAGGGRDPEALAQALDALRSAHFDAAR